LMEEVDRILIQSLQALGCHIEDTVQNLHEFDVNTLFCCVSKCVSLITSKTDLPLRLPQNISTRFKICGELAQLCQSIGYRGDIGYQTFLSVNENEARKLLNFLIESVPKEISIVASTSTTLDPWEILEKKLSAKLTVQLTNQTWIPYNLVGFSDVTFSHSAAAFAHRLGFTPSKQYNVVPLHVPTYKKIRPGDELLSSSQSYAFEQVNFQDLADSLFYENQVACWLERRKESNYLIPGRSLTNKVSDVILEKIQTMEKNDMESENRNMLINNNLCNDNSGLVSRSRFMHADKIKQEENLVDHTEEIDSLKSAISENDNIISQIELQLKKLLKDTNKYEQFKITTKADIENLNKEIALKKQATEYILSIDPETERLQNAIEKLKVKLTILDSQWNDIRQTLADQKDSLNKSLNDRLSQSNEKLQLINDMKQKGRSLINDIKDKDEVLQRLNGEYEQQKTKLNNKRDNNRQFFTKQILEIVANTTKQKEEINKTIIETRVLQKDLNRLTEKLERTFQVTDTRLFKDAKVDECARRSYKMLIALHNDCDFIYKIVEEIGVIIREIRELEDQIEGETQKNMSTNLETLLIEYKKIKDENLALKSKFSNSKQ
ncbi:unnamed protein product, partial [Didymodactylos carnosus]